ncbi:hypothetical protein [Streptomyces sp. NPDC048385]|uniref:hypothetical protein n=1 Tax=unclassified Streptomyces TaxID=2593676 RepID=UPI003449CCEB
MAVIDAGPCGVSTAARPRARGITVRVLGGPMVGWRDHLPAGMILNRLGRVRLGRLRPAAASGPDCPQRGHILAGYRDAVGKGISRPSTATAGAT